MGLTVPDAAPGTGPAGTEVSAVSPNFVTPALDFLAAWARTTSP